MVKVVPIGMTAAHTEDPLAEQLRQRLLDPPALPPADQIAGNAPTNPYSRSPGHEQDGAAIRTRVLAVERPEQIAWALVPLSESRPRKLSRPRNAPNARVPARCTSAPLR